MNRTIIIIGLIFSLGLSISLLYLRMKKWLKNTVKWLITITLAIIGLIGFLVTRSADYRFLFYSMMIPSVYLLIDNLFKKISVRFQGRDFYLYLRNSDDIDEHDEDISALDIVFSFTILGLIMGLCVLGAVLFGKQNLYGKWMLS